MPTRNVVLTDHQAEFVDSLVASGRYQNVSEALRSGLRLLEREEAAWEQVRRGVLEGLAQVERGGQVHGEGPVPAVRRLPLGRTDPGDPGVVHQHVEPPAARFDRRGHQVLARHRVGDVGGQIGDDHRDLIAHRTLLALVANRHRDRRGERLVGQLIPRHQPRPETTGAFGHDHVVDGGPHRLLDGLHLVQWYLEGHEDPPIRRLDVERRPRAENTRTA